MADEKQFKQPMYWRLGPMYEVRFIAHSDGSLHIEFADGKQMEVFAHILQQLDLNRQAYVAAQPKPDISDNPETQKELTSGT